VVRRNIPTEKVVTESVEHYFCNLCGGEMDKPGGVTNDGNGVEITLTLNESFIDFDLCTKCVLKMVNTFVIPPTVIDRREG
jgi:hypothetical protein